MLTANTRWWEGRKKREKQREREESYNYVAEDYLPVEEEGLISPIYQGDGWMTFRIPTHHHS